MSIQPTPLPYITIIKHETITASSARAHKHGPLHGEGNIVFIGPTVINLPYGIVFYGSENKHGPCILGPLGTKMKKSEIVVSIPQDTLYYRRNDPEKITQKTVAEQDFLLEEDLEITLPIGTVFHKRNEEIVLKEEMKVIV